MFLLYCTLGVNCIACGKKTTKQESLCRWNRAERDKRDGCDCKRGGEPRGCFFPSEQNTGTEASPPIENTAPTRTYVWDQDIRAEGGRKTRGGGTEGRERKGAVPPTCCRMWLLNKKPQTEKKKKAPTFPCLRSAGASSRLAGWLAAAAAVRPQHPAERRTVSEHWTRCF